MSRAHPSQVARVCVICGGKPRTGLVACDSCVSALQRAWRALPGDLDELQVTLTRQDRLEAPGKLGVGSVRQITVHWTASELQRVAERCLASWAAYVWERSTVMVRPVGSIRARCEWLAWHARRLQRDEAIGRCFDDVARLRGDIESTIDRRVGDQWCGRCDQLLEPRRLVCGADLYRRTGDDSTSGDELVTCPKCDHIYEYEKLRRQLLDRLPDVLARPSTIANGLSSLEVPVTQHRIDVWVNRRQLIPHGFDKEGKRLYRVGDVMTLLDAAPARGRPRGAR